MRFTSLTLILMLYSWGYEVWLQLIALDLSLTLLLLVRLVICCCQHVLLRHLFGSQTNIINCEATTSLMLTQVTEWRLLEHPYLLRNVRIRNETSLVSRAKFFLRLLRKEARYTVASATHTLWLCTISCSCSYFACSNLALISNSSWFLLLMPTRQIDWI